MRPIPPNVRIPVTRSLLHRLVVVLDPPEPANPLADPLAQGQHITGMVLTRPQVRRIHGDEPDGLGTRPPRQDQRDEGSEEQETLHAHSRITISTPA